MMHLGLVAHYFRGAFYPSGGQVIADRLAARIEVSRGRICLRVEKSLIEDGRAVGADRRAR